MRSFFITFMIVIILFSFTIPIYLNIVNAQQTVKTTPECFTTEDVYDCFDENICENYDDCFKCCRRLEWSVLRCRTECHNTWPQAFPTTSNVVKAILVLFIIGLGIYLMKRRIGLAKS